MQYKKLGIIKFGRLLLETDDLDPVYVMLWKAKLDKKILKKWLLAYWWFYSAKTATKIVFGSEPFYKAAVWEAKNGGHRSAERRHFRGQACFDCIDFFKREYPKPWGAVNALEELAITDPLLSYRKGFWPQFGPWIWFKVRDMLERLNIANVQFPIDSQLYEEPEAGAWIAAQRFPNLWSDNHPPTTTEVVELLVEKFSKYKAPPRYERPVGVQEVETILCKWKSHQNGHYWVGKDTEEIRDSLTGETKFMRRYLP